MKQLRIIIGLLVWVAVAAGLYGWLGTAVSSHGTDNRRLSTDLLQYATAKRPTAKLQLDQPMTVAVGDPIFVVDGAGAVRQVGEIHNVQVTDLDPSSGQAVVTSAEALFYPTAPALNDEARLTYYATPTSMAWVVETMLPPDKRHQIVQEITDTYQAHHAEILQELRPVVVAGFYDAMNVVERDLAAAVQSRRGELEQLGSKYQEQVVQKEIVPLVRREIWPIVRKHAEPLANEMGSEMWKRASLWRFGWRYAYDKIPMTEQNLASKEWNRFLNDEAMPVVEGRTSDMVAVQQQILADVAKNPEVRKAVRDNLARVIDDPEFRAIVWQIIREVLVDNPRLRETLDAHWQSPEAQQALNLATERIEPCVRRIGDLMFGTRDGGITPEFARVLRNQILGKDRRWLVLETAAVERLEPVEYAAPENVTLRVYQGTEPQVYPFVARTTGG